MSPILILLLAGLVTYALRSALVVAGGVISPGGWIEQRIAYVGPAVLAALVASSLFVADGAPSVGRPAEILAVAAAFGIVIKTENVALALVVGLPVFWVASMLGLG